MYVSRKYKPVKMAHNEAKQTAEVQHVARLLELSVYVAVMFASAD